ncbi:MAG: ATP-binding protein [Lysobacteraceae bacterium]
MIDNRLHENSGASSVAGDEALRRELYFFALYRTLIAALFALLAFGSLPDDWAALARPLLARADAVLYLIAAVLLFVLSRNPDRPQFPQVVAGVLIDIAATIAMVHAVENIQMGVAMSLMVGFAAAGAILPIRVALVMTLTAGTLLLAEYLMGRSGGRGRDLVEVLICSFAYVAVAKLGNMLGGQTRESHALAEQRTAEAESLSKVNELIIRRMGTGVLVVDAPGFIHLHNEAAWALLGQPVLGTMVLGDVAPELAQRLYRWRVNGSEAKPLSLVPDMPEVIPRFARLSTSTELFVIFLDDSTMVSRRAEELTLTNLGRLSASIAHEIRNPLAAISYSAQLLEESPDMPETDRRLVEIILHHCTRMNGIIENVLNLSRRERSRPETLDVSLWVFRFVEEYHANHHFEDGQELRATAQVLGLAAMADPAQLNQVVSCLVQNAIVHGHLPGEPPRVTVAARRLPENGQTVIEVLDRGPGIPPKVAATIFEPFVTTHEHGTGLGLYIARQLCEANQATLDYVPTAGGGSCFRIALTSAQRLEQARSSLRTAQGVAVP